MQIPLNIDWQRILLHLFNFVILVGGLYFLLYSPVKKFMAQREAHYRELDAEANKRLAHAAELENEARQKLDGAEQEITEKRIKAEAELRQSSKTLISEASTQAEKLIVDAKTSAEAEKRAIIGEADREITEMAKEAVEKILNKSTDDAFDMFLELAERDVKNEK